MNITYFLNVCPTWGRILTQTDKIQVGPGEQQNHCGGHFDVILNVFLFFFLTQKRAATCSTSTKKEFCFIIDGSGWQLLFRLIPYLH